jgi:hypothetical protein
MGVEDGSGRFEPNSSLTRLDMESDSAYGGHATGRRPVDLSRHFRHLSHGHETYERQETEK